MFARLGGGVSPVGAVPGAMKNTPGSIGGGQVSIFILFNISA